MTNEETSGQSAKRIDWEGFRHRPTEQEILRLRELDQEFRQVLKVAWVNFVAARKAATIEFHRQVEVAWIAANQREVERSQQEDSMF